LHTLEQRLNAKIESESRRLEDKFSIEIHVLIARMDRQDAQIDRLDAKLDQHAKWLIGAQVTTLAFVAGIAIQLFLR
jgi:hypothetical protein